MKKLLTITAILFSVTLFSQESKLIFKSNGGKVFDDAKSFYQFSDGYSEIAKIKSSGQDTLEITYPALIKNKHLFKYIKVGDKIFQEVEPIKKWYAHPDSWQPTPYFGYGTITPAIGIMRDTLKINYSDTSYLIKKHKKQ